MNLNFSAQVHAGFGAVTSALCHLFPAVKRHPFLSSHSAGEKNSASGGLLQTALLMPGSLEVELLFQQGEEGPGITHHPDSLHGSTVHQLGQG